MKAYVLLAILTFSTTAMAADELASKAAPAQAETKHGGKLRALDKDGDGAISREEFRALADQRFTKMDTNGDGKISKEEFQAGHAEGMHRNGKNRKETTFP